MTYAGRMLDFQSFSLIKLTFLQSTASSQSDVFGLFLDNLLLLDACLNIDGTICCYFIWILPAFLYDITHLLITISSIIRIRIRVAYVPFFPDASWPGFLYCLKYLGFVFVCVFRPIGVWHRFLMFLKRSWGTLNQNNIEILARTHLGKMAGMVTLVIIFLQIITIIITINLSNVLTYK